MLFIFVFFFIIFFGKSANVRLYMSKDYFQGNFEKTINLLFLAPDKKGYLEK